MPKLSVVILSNTVTDLIFETTINCINSLKKSEKFGGEFVLEIILVESNKEYDKNYQFSSDVKVIIPNEEFGFHKFLNIGIKESHGDFIALCNNDLIFHENWFSEIYKISKERKDILSFSPIDPRVEVNKLDGIYEVGYKVGNHLKGWCFICNRSLFDKMGLLDENFKFFYSDNDFALTFLYNNIKHAVVFKSYVSHLQRVTTNEVIKKKGEFFIETNENKSIPKYLYKDDNIRWIINDRQALKDHFVFYKKWGRLNRFFLLYKYAIILNLLNLNIIVKILFRIKGLFKL